MKIVVIGLINFNIKLKPMIDEEFKRFIKSSPLFWGLENAISRVRAMESGDESAPYEAAIQELNQFEAKYYRMTSPERPVFGDSEIGYMRNRIMELSNSLREQTPSTFKEGRMKAMHILKLERQLYWLSWYEDMLCELIENKLHIAREGQDINTAYIVLMPEFMFTDMKQNTKHDSGPDFVEGYVKPYYEEVMDAFINGRLPEVQRQGRGIPGHRLAEIASEGTNVIIFAGTIIWKTRADEYYINSAPVFWDGGCRFLWDKQTISDIDGTGYLEEEEMRIRGKGEVERAGKAWHRHPIDETSELTRNYMENLTEGIKPWFTCRLAGQSITFGLSVCLDFTRRTLSEASVQVHVLLSYGIEPREKINATNLFLYCDGYFNCFAAVDVSDPKVRSDFDSEKKYIPYCQQGRDAQEELFVIRELFLL